MKNNQKGITLVALVITIIVLLILAGVSIAALGGQNGILTNASLAKQKDALGAMKDQVAIAVNEGIHDYYDVVYVKENAADGTTVINVVKTKILAATTNDATVTVVENKGSDSATAPYIVTITTKDKSPITSTAKLKTDGSLTAWTDSK